MKELSIKEKAKRYDEAIPLLKGLLDGIHEVECDIVEEDIIKIFPELKESEDEKIRKAIKYGLDYVFTNNTTIFEVTKEQCLSWLEKQGEKESITCPICGWELEKQDEQKPADKVEPKFKVGDWVTIKE